ncbi:MAG: T9SS type A sorting domain-containing protein [Bacteroidetes bacterium]|nr:T9SS type A sorting domain-containing protein [Bacteroidota bacterium]
MKIKTLFIFIFFIFFISAKGINAQNVYLPDTVWRNYLISIGIGGCISNDSLDINCLDLVTVDTMIIDAMPIYNLAGLQYFTGLKSLTITHCPLSFVPALPDSLSYLQVAYDSSITSLPTLPNGLITLTCNNNNLISLPQLPPRLVNLHTFQNPSLHSLGNLPSSLEYLHCGSDSLTSFPYAPNLKQIYAGFNQISSISLFPPQLELLDIDNNGISSLPPLPASIRNLSSSFNLLTSFPELPDSIELLGLMENNISQIDSFPKYLRSLNISFNNLDSTPPFPERIEKIAIAYNNISVLQPIPESVTDLECYGNNITELPVLPLNLDWLWIDDNPISCLPPLNSVDWIRIGGTHIHCLPNYIQYNQADVDLDTFPLCEPSSLCPVNWNISGKIYQDDNLNCIADPLENGLSQIPVVLDSAGITLQTFLPNGSGNYSFRAEPGNYKLRIDAAPLPFLYACPFNGIDSVILTPINSHVDSVDFSVACNVYADYVSNSITPSTQFRPNHFVEVYMNAGEISQNFSGNCFSDSGRVTATFNGPVHYAGPSTGALIPDYQNSDSVIWVVSDFSLIDPNVAFNIMLSTDSAAQNGDTISTTLNISSGVESNLSNNFKAQYFLVRSSYDPNEKIVSPEKADTSVHLFTYTIYFQNTGNVFADNIYIIDTLDSDLDPNTFQFITSSHDVVTQLLPGNILRFNYPNINLADSFSNELASHGFYKFSINRKANSGVGSEINNKANIYFDFNQPIETNICSVTIEAILSADNQLMRDKYIPVVYPNPSKNEVSISCGRNLIDKLYVYNLLGSRCDIPIKINPSEAQLNIQSLDEGVYIVKIISKSGIFQTRFVKSN